MAAVTVCCWACSTRTAVPERVGRADSCESCRADLRCCRNCLHYDETLAAQCREVIAELVADKERQNFCEHFAPLAQPRTVASQGLDARAKLEALFKKPPR